MTNEVFRREALEHHDRRRDHDTLLMLPAWARWTYWLLLALVLASGVFVAAATVSDYAEGTAIVRASNRVALTSRGPGVVAEVSVESGQHVRANAVLVRFHAAADEAQRASVQREFDATLIRTLADPADRSAHQALAALSTQRDLLDARLRDRQIRAPSDGIIGDVRVQVGQSVGAGEPLLSLTGPSPEFHVVALFPGHRRPVLQPGQRLRLELHGYPYAYQEATVTTIHQEIMGPQEVRRLLGPEVSDAIALPGASVALTATLPGDTFIADRRAYQYHDGMVAKARARLRSQRLLTDLVPWLRGWSHRP